MQSLYNTTHYNTVWIKHGHVVGPNFFNMEFNKGITKFHFYIKRSMEFSGKGLQKSTSFLLTSIILDG